MLKHTAPYFFSRVRCIERVHEPRKTGKLAVKLGEKLVPHLFCINVKFGVMLAELLLYLAKLFTSEIEHLGVILLRTAGRVDKGEILQPVAKFVVRIAL